MKYRILDPRVPYGPNGGILYATSTSRDHLYFINDARKLVATGLFLDIPDGRTVIIEGLYENEAKGLHVLPRRIDGPRQIDSLDIVVHNEAPATIRLDPYTPIASIRAVTSPKLSAWTDLAVTSDDKAA